MPYTSPRLSSLSKIDRSLHRLLGALPTGRRIEMIASTKVWVESVEQSGTSHRLTLERRITILV
jgi:hypothetical protein